MKAAAATGAAAVVGAGAAAAPAAWVGAGAGAAWLHPTRSAPDDPTARRRMNSRRVKDFFTEILL